MIRRGGSLRLLWVFFFFSVFLVSFALETRKHRASNFSPSGRGASSIGGGRDLSIHLAPTELGLVRPPPYTHTHTVNLYEITDLVQSTPPAPPHCMNLTTEDVWSLTRL